MFGSSLTTPDSPDERLAYDVGRALARGGFIVCNGGYGGTMEASARGAKEAGGKTIGIITRFFARSKPNPWIDRVITVDTVMDRLLKLLDTGDGYVVLRGGTGTLLELAAAWELMNKGVIVRKPIVAVGEFWGTVLNTLKQELVHEKREDSSELVSLAHTPEECTDLLIHRLGIRYEA